MEDVFGFGHGFGHGHRHGYGYMRGERGGGAVESEDVDVEGEKGDSGESKDKDKKGYEKVGEDMDVREGVGGAADYMFFGDEVGWIPIRMAEDEGSYREQLTTVGGEVQEAAGAGGAVRDVEPAGEVTGADRNVEPGGEVAGEGDNQPERKLLRPSSSTVLC